MAPEMASLAAINVGGMSGSTRAIRLEKELQQIDKQIVAAEIRAVVVRTNGITRARRSNSQRKSMSLCAPSSPTSKLYSWTETQIAGAYFRAYQLAVEVAKRAELGLRFELNIDSPQYIQFGYWDSLKKGLLAGERLLQDIKRMEVAYLDLNRRDYELTKHISISQLDPVELLKLRATGKCEITLPEELFDMDGPGHYLRRIKSVTMSIPCVTGPYTSVNCTLTLNYSSIRKATALLPGSSNGYERPHTNGETADVARFVDDNHSTKQSIVTSFGQNDGGLFETNLRDERYLPFEGAGVISRWTLQLPSY